MPDELSVASALQILESAFAPFRCFAESRDHGNAARFKIFDALGETYYGADGLLKGQVTDARRLEWLICDVRERLEHDGHELSPWQMPEAD